MQGKRSLTVRDTVFIGVLSAMCAIATTIKIPFGVGAMVHMGTAFLYTAAIIFGGVYAGFAGAIGSGFYDLMMGFSPYTIWSFVIKGIAGLIAGGIVCGLWPESQTRRNVTPSIMRMFLGCIAAAIWTLCGYIIAWWQVTGSFTIAIGNIPGSLLTSGVGLVVALLLAPKLRNIIIR